MKKIKFRWVGLNKHFNKIQIQEGITTKDIIDGKTLSFFAESNKGESGNCQFISEDLYTGLKDKNGKEIYEGDIVEFYTREMISQDGVIKFDSCSFYISNIGYNYYSWIDYSAFKVLGNIHENPELL